MLNFIINRLKEPSTWRGIFLALGAAGVVLVPEQQAAIAAAATALIGLLEVFRKERSTPVKPAE